MVTPEGVQSPKMSEWPLFDLATLGGPPAVARWINLVTAHRRAVAPVVNPYRIGLSTAALTLLEVAAAIEYWVRVNRPAKWASTKFADAVAARVGAPFADWVGDPEKWSASFWRTNNLLKHEPDVQPEPELISALARSGRHLLAAALLDRVAGSKAPSKRVFKSHQLNDLGSQLRERFG